MVTEIDEHMVKRINAGDIKAFEQMYDTYYAYLCAVAVAYVFDRIAACEIVNDVFLNVWQKKEALVYPVKPYLRQAIRNRSLNYIRTSRNFEKAKDGLEQEIKVFQEQYILTHDDPFRELESKETEEKIRQEVEKLPEKCRLIFKASLYENKSYEEIARDNKLSVSTVRVQMKIALTRLRKALRNFFNFFFFA